MGRLRRFDRRPETIRIYRIPADITKECTYEVIGSSLPDIQAALNGGMVELVHTPLLPFVDGVGLVMAVDEDGHRKQLPFNRRAGLMYPGTSGIVGDALILGEALVADEEQYYEVDIVGIPENFQMIAIRG